MKKGVKPNSVVVAKNGHDCGPGCQCQGCTNLAIKSP